MKRIAAGFTLIELLVVIGILSLLMVVLVPQVLEGQQTASIFADQKNLDWHFQAYQQYSKIRKHPLPERGGHNFVLAPWVKGVVGHTEENRDRYFIPGSETKDPRWIELSKLPAKDIWKDFPELTSEDTHYAGRSHKEYRGMDKGDQALMADDNEFGNSHPDGTINVLLASGSVRTLYKTEQLKEYWVDDDPDFYIKVGPDSQVPLLQTLLK